MKIRHALTVILAAAALALTACTSAGPSDSADNPATTTVIETTDATTPAPDSDDMTQTVVDLSWDQQTEADKNAMCNGLALFGTKWGADQMRAGAGGDDSLDWDRAAVLVEQKCAQR